MARSIAAPAPRRLTRRRARLAFGVPRPLGPPRRVTRAGIAGVWARRRLRIALLAVLIAVPLLGGWMVAAAPLLAERRSSTCRFAGLAAVHGADTAAIETALTGAAHGMSTLAVNPAALRAAVAAYPIVRCGQRSPELSARPAHRSGRAAARRGARRRRRPHRRGGRRDRARPRISVELAAAPERRQGRARSPIERPRATLPAIGGSVRGASLLGRSPCWAPPRHRWRKQSRACTPGRRA